MRAGLVSEVLVVDTRKRQVLEDDERISVKSRDRGEKEEGDEGNGSMGGPLSKCILSRTLKNTTSNHRQ